MPPPATPPIGLRLARAARIVGRAFDAALAEVGGSVPMWLVLLNLKMRTVASQRELAEAVGVTEATLTHHLNALDSQGLITRRRDSANRRVHVVRLTSEGEAAFLRLRAAAAGFDERLRSGLTDARIAELGALLDRLAANTGIANTGTATTGAATTGAATTGAANTGAHDTGTPGPGPAGTGPVRDASR